MRMEAFVGLPDGSEWLRDQVEGDSAEPTLLGAELAKRLIDTGAREILDRAEKWSGRV
jgi:hydroxymethylbilane synthase